QNNSPKYTGINSADKQNSLRAYMGQDGQFKEAQFFQAKRNNDTLKDETADQVLGTAKGKLIDIPNVTYLQIIGNPATVIASYANEHGMDVVVVGNRGFGALKKWFKGSVSKKVANNAKCPVFVVK